MKYFILPRLMSLLVISALGCAKDEKKAAPSPAPTEAAKAEGSSANAEIQSADLEAYTCHTDAKSPDQAVIVGGTPSSIGKVAAVALVDGDYQIMVKGSDRCLSIDPRDAGNRRVIFASCDSSAQQIFSVKNISGHQSATDVRVKLIHRASGLAVSVQKDNSDPRSLRILAAAPSEQPGFLFEYNASGQLTNSLSSADVSWLGSLEPAATAYACGILLDSAGSHDAKVDFVKIGS